MKPCEVRSRAAKLSFIEHFGDVVSISARKSVAGQVGGREITNADAAE
jgi:hypothetical protein